VQRFIDQKWVTIQPEDYLKISQLEGQVCYMHCDLCYTRENISSPAGCAVDVQVWLSLYNLIMDKDCRNKYHFHTTRKAAVGKVD